MSEVCGYVSILGRPNAGKSTLLNALTGVKLAIVSDKPQTTRTALQGVLTEGGAQIIFVDTPGIHKSDTTINRHMMRTVRSALDQLDVLLYVADASRHFGDEDEQALDLVRKCESPVILALNKIDQLKERHHVLAQLSTYQEKFAFAAYVPISATKGEGLDTLKKEIVARLPEGPALFPEDHITDLPERFLGAEMIREQILLMMRQEVPHAAAVIVEKWEEKKKIIRVTATIYVERDGQKGIVIGKGGETLKKIGTFARMEMEAFFGKQFFLELFVKVKPDWRESAEFLNEIDWRKMTGEEQDNENE